MPDRAARPDNPTFSRGNKRNTKQIFSRRILDGRPRHAAVHRMKHCAFVTDNPPRLLLSEIDRVQRERRVGRTHGPTLPAGAREQDLAALTDDPTVRVVDEEDVREIVAATFG